MEQIEKDVNRLNKILQLQRINQVLIIEDTSGEKTIGIELMDGTILYGLRDNEGNGLGAIALTNEKSGVQDILYTV